MNVKAIRWILFIAFAFTAPVFYFLGVVAGLIPLVVVALEAACLLRMSGIHGQECTDVLCLFFGDLVNIALWSLFLFYIAGACARAVDEAPTKWKLPIVTGIIVLLIGMTFLPLYGEGNVGGGGVGMCNLYRFLTESHWLK